MRALAGIVAFEGKADLHDAEAQQDCADGFDGAEHKVAQIVDGRQRIICKGTWPCRALRRDGGLLGRAYSSRRPTDKAPAPPAEILECWRTISMP